jgi:hypothetical protein
MWEKLQNTSLPSVVRGLQGEEENRCLIYKFEIFYSDSDVSVAYSKAAMAPLRGHMAHGEHC